MKRKLFLFTMSLMLIVLMTLAFVACDDKNNDNPSPIQLTEDMTAEEIIEILPNIKNLTFEFVGGTEEALYTYRMTVSSQGCITKYIYDDYEIVGVIHLDKNILTQIKISPNIDENSKHIITLSNEEIEHYNQLKEICKSINHKLENGIDWNIENGALIFFSDPTGMEYYDGKLIYKDFNTTELDFDYYLSLDIPMFSDSDNE